MRMVFKAAVAALLLTSSPALAGPDDDIRNEARKLIKEIEATPAGQTCRLGVWFNGSRITASANPALRAGDKLLYLADTETSPFNDEMMADAITAIPADTAVPARIERDGQVQDAQLQCGNAAFEQARLKSGLELAGQRKWDECVTHFRTLAANDPQAAEWLLRCASVSKNAQSYDVPKLLANVYGQAISMAAYKPESRSEVAKAIVQREAFLGRYYEGLKSKVESEWDNGAALLSDAQPDWLDFRRNAERAVLTGFFDPSSAQFTWPYGFTWGEWKPPFQARKTGYWTCGTINAKNRMGGYVGSRFFVVVMDENAQPIFTQVGTDGAFDMTGCQNSLAQLPPAPASMFEASDGGNTPAMSRPSMADELAKLAKLFEQGALTQEEYDAAKARILQGN